MRTLMLLRHGKTEDSRPGHRDDLTAPVEVTDRLYQAGGDEILALIRDLDHDAEHVLVVGHSPALPAVAHELADPHASDPEAMGTLERHFPAGALATLSVSGNWSELDPA